MTIVKAAERAQYRVLYQRRSKVGRNATATTAGVAAAMQRWSSCGIARLVREDKLTSIAKDLFYRERNLLQHDMTSDEARLFTRFARRIAALLLERQFDAGYLTANGNA